MNNLDLIQLSYYNLFIVTYVSRELHLEHAQYAWEVYNMLFSVIIPCYNSKDYIRVCMDSVLTQTFSDYEVVVIDDGSTDGTSDILDQYATDYSQVCVYHFPNGGVSIARKHGISLSNGEYVIFVDSDDTINPDLLLELSKQIHKNNQLELIRYQVKMVNDTPNKDHERYNFSFPNNYQLMSGTTALKSWSVSGKKYAVYWLFAFKKSTFSKTLKLLPEMSLRCYEDVALIPILVAASGLAVTIDYVGYNYTCNNVNSLTNVQSLVAEYQRANDFYNAYMYATQNFAMLGNVSKDDIEFLFRDYTRRLKGKYDSLPDELKTYFECWFK